MIKYTVVTGDHMEEREIPELSEEEAKGLKEIGQASGMSKEYCAFLARKYAKDFEKRVVGYRVTKPKGKCQQGITFYEKKGGA